jgi:hypothetical protein
LGTSTTTVTTQFAMASGPPKTLHSATITIMPTSVILRMKGLA